MSVQFKATGAADGEQTRPPQDNRTGLCDDSNVKLANQDEESKLVTTMDNLHAARSRNSANMAHERHRVDKTLRSLKSQRNLMDKARVDNVFKRRRPVPQTHNSEQDKSERSVSFSDQTPTPEPDGNFDTDSELANKTQQVKPRSDEVTTPPLSRPTFMRQRSSSSPTIPVIQDAPTMTSFTPPVSRRPHRSRIRSSKQQESRELRVVDDVSIEDLESEDSGGGDERLYDIKWKNVVIPDRPNSRPKLRQFPSLSAGSGRKHSTDSSSSRPRTASLASVKQSPINNDRPQTASAALLFGRSRRELTRLTHIDAIAAADLEMRRRMWFSQLAHQRESEQAQLKVRIDKFIAKVEDDKKKLQGVEGTNTGKSVLSSNTGT